MPNHPEVFGLGDMVAFKNSSSSDVLPMLAQVAHKQSEGVAGNIINLIEGRALVPYKYKHMGDLVSLGEWMAAGELFGVKIFGHLVWLFWRGVYLSKLFSGAKKATPYAAARVAEMVAQKLRKTGVGELAVKVKGVGSGRDSAVRALANQGFSIVSIKDVTPLPHNGPRPKKVRRV